MAHTPRSATTLPHPLPGSSTRDLYLPATPGLRRPDHHIPRSPSFPATIRRNPLSPTPASISSGYVNPLRMDAPYPAKQAQNIPPLGSLVTLGTLSYADHNQTKIMVDVTGCIDKGFFVADNEWTCYRRNYFSCICSYSLSPSYPNEQKQFVLTGTQQAYNVVGFAMSISAVVADNEEHAIELVQHTPKRDKGPTSKPEKVRLNPKPPTHHHPVNHYSSDATRFEGYGLGGPGNMQPNEHTFERIQFKQATANNGKRRAAQQYYHLVVELWAEVTPPQPGAHSEPQFVRVAYRKSAKMIVRGRSPGHYQSERRGSTSSGPGSGGGSMGGGGGGYSNSVVGGSDYTPIGTGQLAGGYYGDARNSGYGGTHRSHTELTMEPMISADEIKAMADSKGYQYYPASLYETSDQHHDTRQQQSQQPHHHQSLPHTVELFPTSSSASRSENEHALPSHMATGLDPSQASKIKSELDTLPPVYYQGMSFQAQRCGRFEGKSGSAGYYPTPTMLQ